MATGHSIAASMVREKFESNARKGVEKLLREGIADGEDTSSLLKKLAVYLLDKDGDFLTAVRTIPGASHVPHMATIAVSHLLEDTKIVDSLLPGSDTVALRGLKFGLKTGLAGAIAGIGEGATSFLQGEVDGVVDQHVSPSNRPATGRTGRLDEVLYISNDRFGLARPLVMVRDSSTGEVQLTDRGNPRVEDAEGMAYIIMWEQANPETVETKKAGGKGGGQTTVTVKKATPPWRRIWLSEYIALLKSSPGTSVDAVLIAQLEKLVAPPKTSDWEEGYSDDTLLVQGAIARSAPDMDTIMREDMEDQWSSMRARKPPMRMVNYHIGATFAPKITAEGKLSVADLQAMIDVMDIHLRGDQKMFTRVRKLLTRGKDWVAGANMSPRNLVAFAVGTLGLSAPVLIWISYVSFGLIGLLIGLFAPSAPMGSPTFTIAMLSALVGSCIGWSCTWIFPLIEKICKPFFGDSVSPDWLTSLGRRINAFSLGLGAKLLTVMILMEFPMVAKVVIVAVGALGSFGDVFTLTEMKEHTKIRSMLLRGLWFGTWIFTATGIAVALGIGLARGITGFLISGPDMFSVMVAAVGVVVGAIGYLLFSTFIGQLCLLATFVGLAAWRMTKFERVWDGSAFKIQEIGVWRPTLGGVAVLGLVMILGGPFGTWWKTTIVSRSMESSLSWVQSWDDDPTPAPPAASGTAVTTPSVTKPQSDTFTEQQCAEMAHWLRPSSCD
jgi:hypothetical protein